MFEIFEFDKVNDGYSIIDYYDNDQDILVIPDTYKGLPVVEIDTYTFYFQIISEVVLPKFLTHISDSAFYCCDILRKVSFPDSLVTINHNAFSCCKKLTEIIIPASVEYIGADAFSGCISLKKVVVLNPHISVDISSFSGCKSIQEASFFLWEFFDDSVLFNLVCFKFLHWHTLPYSEQSLVLDFVKSHFNCIDSIFFSDSVLAISLLISENISLSLHHFHSYLNHSINLQRTQITAILLEYRNNNFSADEISAFSENIELVELGVLPPSLLQLGEKWHFSLVNDSICITGYRGNNSFETIPALTSDGFPITSLKKSFITDFFKIEHLVIDAPILTIDDETFKNSFNLLSIKLPSSLQKIGFFAFKNCSNLELVELSSSTSIKHNSFQNCPSVRFVYT